PARLDARFSSEVVVFHQRDSMNFARRTICHSRSHSFVAVSCHKIPLNDLWIKEIRRQSNLGETNRAPQKFESKLLYFFIHFKKYINTIIKTTAIMPRKFASHSITPIHQGIADSTINSAPFSIFSGDGLVMEIIAKDKDLIKRGSITTRNTIKIAISLDFIMHI
ncbi:MAG: hypothetical protein KAT65_01790, partial [Methanophagales archaeon]|nr:hypothetical protein [Methanophagales archaeon]